MSDRGYSSMTLDDAKRISIVIGSQDSLDGKSRDGKVPNGHVKPLPDNKVVAKETTPGMLGSICNFASFCTTLNVVTFLSDLIVYFIWVMVLYFF